jgi:NAD(P)-dependent dehydrogenase (short-subunit alcohol dehydrogenase family)
MEITNKVTVVTGGASGIGKSIALAFANLGANIVIADIDDIRLEEVRQEIDSIGCRVLAVHCDVTKNADVEKLKDCTLSTMGKADILVSNAGISIYGILERMTIVDYELVMDVNFLGTVRCILSFLPHMLKKSSGYIVITASAGGLNPEWGPYPISKYALIGYAEALYCYLRPKGIMVSALCPSVVNTNLPFNASFRGNKEEVKNMKLWAKQAFTETSDVILPDDVANIVVNAINEERFFILTHRIEKCLNEAISRGRDILKLERYLQDNRDIVKLPPFMQ